MLLLTAWKVDFGHLPFLIAALVRALFTHWVLVSLLGHSRDGIGHSGGPLGQLADHEASKNVLFLIGPY